KIYSLPGHGQYGGRRAVAFTPDGKQILSWGDDFYLRKWDIATGKAVFEHRLQTTGGKLPAADAGEQERLWEIMVGEGAFTPDGKTFVLDVNNQFHVFDLATGKDLHQIDNEGSHVISMAISPDSKMLLASAWCKPVVTKLPDGSTRYSS